MEVKTHGLKFHKFFWYVSLPLSLINNIGFLFTLYALCTVQGLGWSILLDIVVILLQCACIAIIFYGFLKRNSKGYYAIFALYVINVVYSLFLVGLYANLNPSGLVEVASSFVVTLVFAAVILYYYRKRKYQIFDFEPLA
ncbi:MAG: hypothetical protein ACRCZJ_05560 [Erysipelotrichaceae bacterium]